MTGSRPPPLDRAKLHERLFAMTGVAPTPALLDSLLEHYAELRRWAPRVSLIGPGSWAEAIDRHYAESVAGAGLVAAGNVLDVGSGAGFPGLIVAATRADTEVTLVERRPRKAAFLRAAARRMGLHVEVLEGDLRTVLPQARRQALDSVTLRAVRLDDVAWQVVLDHTKPEAAFVLWQGLEAPDLPAALQPEASIELPGRQSRIVRYRRQRP